MLMEVIVIAVLMIVKYVVDFDQQWVIGDEEVIVK
jgi:hypothetical protein